MATASQDPKTAPLADDLKDYALTLAKTAFPKNFFCASCGELAIDSWKLLCCNKSICSSCYDKLEFPATCPLCEHAPLEADTCTVNKSLRNTMRVWLQKQKKKGENKSTPQIATPPVEPTPSATEGQQTDESADKPVSSIETGSKTNEPVEQPDGGDGNAIHASPSDVSPAKEGSPQPQDRPTETGGGDDAQKPAQDGENAVEPSNPNAAQGTDAPADGGYGNEGMMNNNMSGMNGMPGQFGFGFPNQANFGMGFNGMNPMNGMPNMMGNGPWNNMNPMDFQNMNMANMPNGMFGGFGGNMAMPGMNDMNSMNMMNFGGGYGNGWQGGMNGGFENFNGFSPMGAYNQSGAQYPQMMNQFPKNNFPNQNRFSANGAAFSQQKNNRRGSYGNFGNQSSGAGSQQNPQSRPGSRHGPQNHDGEPPAGDGEVLTDAKANGEKPEATTDSPQEGKAEGEGTSEAGPPPADKAEGVADESKELTGAADESHEPSQKSTLNPIQTVDSAVDGQASYDPSMMKSAMQSMQPYGPGMMVNFPHGHNMNMPYGGNMGFNHHHHHHGYGSSGGYPNNAYGAATVLTGEPKGLGVEGAPTGPRAMREGRPNTGFSSRMNNMRHRSHAATPPTPSVASGHEAAVASPARRGRASPERDDSLRTKDKSPSRSRSRSKARGEGRTENRERSRSRDRESRHNQRDRSVTPTSQDDDQRRDRRHHRSSRYDERDERRESRDDYNDQHREEKDDRDDRHRSASVESRHRSRRDKDRYHSSRSHRDRSREHRHRHRSRSRSPRKEETYDDDYANGGDLPSESGSRRRHRSDKDKYRERERERERSRDRERDRDRRDRRDRDHDRDYDRDYEYERSREKDRDKKRSRREREDDVEERDYVDEKYRSSRRSRKERDRERERDRDRDYEHTDSHKESADRAVSPPLNAPTGPSAKATEGFSIKGFSKAKRSESSNMPPPPTGPRGFQPPKGPAADRDRERDRRDSRDHRRQSSLNSTPATPTSPSVQDHYAAEREKHTRERVDKDLSNRDKVLHSIHSRATGRSNSITASTRPSLSSKRSRDETEREDAVTAASEDRDRDRRGSDAASTKIPTGPAAHRDKRRKSGDNAIASLFTAGLRKQAKSSSRRGGVKTEGEVERDLERAERERDSRRW